MAGQALTGGAREQPAERLVNDAQILLMAAVAVDFAAMAVMLVDSLAMALCSLAWHDARDRVLCQALHRGRGGRCHV